MACFNSASSRRGKSFVRVGDTVMVCTGSDRGSVGLVKRVVYGRFGEVHVIVDGVALAKKAMKPRNDGSGGGLVMQERKVDRSNVVLYDTVKKQKVKKRKFLQAKVVGEKG